MWWNMMCFVNIVVFILTPDAPGTLGEVKFGLSQKAKTKGLD